MDSVLSRQEKKELCGLLDMPLHCFGNVPMMKDRFKKACLKHHPDKGGDGAKMMRLNCLWSNFQQEMTKLRAEANYSTFQVSSQLFWDLEFNTLKDYLGQCKTRFLKGPSCLTSKSCFCRCITCRLNKQHRDIKDVTERKCLVWGQCFCYHCYLLWFGFPPNWESFDWWQEIIMNTDMHLLRLFNFCK
ncbi:Small T antigen [Lyfec polyomavirus MAF4]|nr:Small T antigen [Lyfec polyomavirus MAF4]